MLFQPVSKHRVEHNHVAFPVQSFEPVISFLAGTFHCGLAKAHQFETKRVIAESHSDFERWAAEKAGLYLTSKFFHPVEVV